MNLTKEKLKKLLVDPGHVNEEDFNLAVRDAEQGKQSLTTMLVLKGLISDANLGRTIADSFDCHFVDYNKVTVADEFLNLIPEVVARSQQSVFFDKTDGKLKLATTSPDNYEFFKLLEKKTRSLIEINYITPLGIEELLKYYKSDLRSQADKVLVELKTNPQNEKNIVKLVNLFLEYAHSGAASDIHIEPLTSDVAVRFRVDGVLHEVLKYPKELHDKIVFRLKIMAHLRTDEHEAAQDGRFSYSTKSGNFDLRLSILPITGGENVVLRLLAGGFQRLSFEELGLLGPDLEKVNRAANKSYGMILTVGPTGSGKTTTLYAILQLLNKSDVNIMTIEDPVEYQTEHIQQTQVNVKKNLTFATGLRSIVRQDPDIIMVGEIRDGETADIAVNAAMTGHLLLSTLHANDAATTFPRLMDMGIESFLVASSINVVVAQRLVRKTCSKCRASYFLSKEELKILKADKELVKILKKISPKKDLSKITFYKGDGCKACSQTGYLGRTGIFEVMEITDELRLLITQKSSADVIDNKAKALGMTTMLEDGLHKAIQGLVTLDEVIRATKS